MDTPVERLCALFNDHFVSRRKIRHGGTRNLAAAIGVDPAVVTRWKSHGKRGNHGNIPPSYNQRIIEACDLSGISRDKLRSILPDQECPCCGQPISPGAILRSTPTCRS